SASAAWALAVVYVVCVSLSRVYLGAHTPLDVAAGLALAVPCAAFTGAAAPALMAAVTSPGLWSGVVCVVVIPGVLGWAVAVHPRPPPGRGGESPLVADSATLLGMLAGVSAGAWLGIHVGDL